MFRKKIIQAPVIIISLIFLVASIISPFQTQQKVQAESDAELQNKSAALQKKIDNANSQAKKLSGQARTLENTIAGLDTDINQATAKIQLTSIKVAELEKKLKQTEKELERQKGLLKANIRALYVRGDASTVEMLVSSDNFSQFIDQQEYLERIKTEVQSSAKEVNGLVEQVKTQKQQQQSLLKQQQAAKRSLDNSKAEKASILNKTKGEETGFKKLSRQLADEQRKINQELLRRSQLVSSGGSGNYPWSNALCVSTGKASGPCWNYEWYTPNNGSRQDPWGFYYRNCTSYVAWKVAQYGLDVTWRGDGGQWANNTDLPTGSSPKKGAIAVFNMGGYGHVAYVEDVSGERVLVSEYNFVADGVFSERWIPASQPSAYIYTPWSR